MMKASHVFLRPDISRDDIITIMEWLNDNEVTQYLHEEQHTFTGVLEALGRSGLPSVTHLFNHNGKMFMVCLRDGNPVGFLKLVRRPQEAELVIVIGEKERWGHGMGATAIAHALSHAFFEWRIGRVIAHIHPNNTRSLRAFRSAGFISELENPTGIKMHITMGHYLSKC